MNHHSYMAWLLAGVFSVWPGMTESAAGDALHWPFAGRLFTTPKTRDMLNKLRSGETRPRDGEKEGITSDTGVTVPRGPRYLTFSGSVIHGTGKATVWLNGRSIEAAKGFVGENYRLDPMADPSRGINIVLVDHVGNFLLIPGQTLDAEEKKIRPSHEIPETELRTAQRGGIPDPTTDPKQTKTAPENMQPNTEKKPLPGSHDRETPPSAEKHSVEAKKARDASQSGGLQELLETVKGVANALH
ncbi:MAG: hypothetical protein HQL64_05635 [Magnetococcales bacterium]|nr:hypothetical protein [Magnetococcales bacterium]